MSGRLDDPKEMQYIYVASKDVFEGKYSETYAIESLRGKVKGTPSSIKMYFKIYSCMRRAECYKMGTSEAFTKFLLNSIYRDSGEEAYLHALIAVKGNYAYRVSVNNAQPGLIRACKESIRECGLPISFEEIPTADFSSQSDSARSVSRVARKIVGVTEEESADDELDETDIEESISALESHNSDEFGSDSDVMELNIQPPASILNVFSRLSYKAWYAIAEFVDNSTQSYISHIDELNNAKDFDKLVVEVTYNAQDNKLTVVDNAFGMEIDRFRDAILLDSRNESQTGRNEFGMGLKTAASWFGKVWTVISTQYGSTNRYTATVDIPKLEKYHLQGTKIYRDNVAADSHGTEIIIEQVTKKITSPRTIGKIRDLLSSMYRRDINNRNIEIWFNGEPIIFDEYPILTNFRGKSWKKDLDFSVEFDGSSYHITGFVAIMNPGSFTKSGFALFRQDRVVIGGTDSNYKPPQIFGQAQSQISLKLFGELNMDDFPVNQAKDGFIWDDGLEDTFISRLKDNIQEYIEIAEMSIKERANEAQFSDQASSEVEQEVTETIDKSFGQNPESEVESKTSTVSDAESSENKKISGEDSDSTGSDVDEYIHTVLNVEPLEEFVSKERSYKIPLSTWSTVSFTVQWARGSKKYWIEYTEKEDHYDVIINIDHPFFMPFSKEEGFQVVLEKFALAFILAERQAKLGSDREGYIQINTIKNYMNRFLERLSEDK